MAKRKPMTNKPKKIIKIPAIYEDDIKPVFKKLGLWKPLKRGEIKCAICGTTITKDNFSAMKKINGEIKMICDKGTCFYDFINL
jgi:hypothetical protein